jgi:protoporphyrinogen oxidase
MTSSSPKKAIIIGAGPAGLTAALELLEHTDIQPIILEKSPYTGGISRTVRFGENRMDIGGHRFFSKSDKVIQWWLSILPLEATQSPIALSYQNKEHIIGRGTASPREDDIMLVRDRKSRIFYEGKFYDYPLVLSSQLLHNLGFKKVCKIVLSYLHSLLFKREEKSLEDFYINRFGSELYETFFKSYTEKVWGKPCTEIGADWGRQRVKGLSVGKAVRDALRRLFAFGSKSANTETSLIEHFLYPKYGPGHMWETVARRIIEKGGVIIYEASVIGLETNHSAVSSVTYETVLGERVALGADYVFSTMPIPELFASFSTPAPAAVNAVAASLEFRDFITVGLLLKDTPHSELADNWIYIHDPHVHVGRIQLFHNWSPYLVKTPSTQLFGFEYFCNVHDELWNKSDAQLRELVLRELKHVGIGNTEVIDMHVEKVRNAYPVYAGSYKDFSLVREYLNGVTNLYPIGRNGMHRYNNQDHSMLTAMASVEAIRGTYRKEDVWNINAEETYHEEK